MTLSDKMVLIACLWLRTNIIPCVRELHPPLQKRCTLELDMFPAFLRVRDAPKDPE